MNGAPPDFANLAVTAAETYPNNANGWIISPLLDLNGASGCLLSFQLLGTSEVDRDILYVDVSTDAVNWASQPVKVGGTIQYGGVSGVVPYWTTATVDLGSWDHQPSLRFRFRFTSDGANTTAGFFIEDISLTATSSTGSYQYMSGTSMAAGFVSGIAGLVQSQYSDIAPLALKDIIVDSLDLDQDLAGILTGGGRVNAYNALTLLEDLYLSANSATLTRIDLAWTGSSTLNDQIVVERRAEGQPGFQTIAQVNASANAYSDTSVSANTTYYYRVRAQTQDGRSGYSNQTLVTTSEPAPAASSGGGGGGGGGGCFIQMLVGTVISFRTQESGSAPSNGGCENRRRPPAGADRFGDRAARSWRRRL